MEENDYTGLMASILVIALFGLSLFVTYKHGRSVERKALSISLIKAIEDTYYEGFRDGLKAVEGLQQ